MLKIYLSKFASEWGTFANGTGLNAAIINYVTNQKCLFLSKLAKRNQDTYMSLVSKSLNAMGREGASKEVNLFGM